MIFPPSRSASLHAGVIPACLIKIAPRAVAFQGNTIFTRELLHWGRETPLKSHEKSDLRDELIKKMRRLAEDMWATPCGVALKGRWKDALTSYEVHQLNSLALIKQKPLEDWTIREIKEGMKSPLNHVLGLLASLEAFYWTQELALAAVKPHPAPAATKAELIELTPHLRDRMNEALGMPWVAHVAPADPRFKFSSFDATSLPQLIQTNLRCSHVAPSFVALIDQLHTANSQTASEEIAVLAEITLKLAKPLAQDKAKYLSAFLMRYVSPHGRGQTLKKIGEALNLTRERIRHICAPLENYFANHEIATPAIDRVFAAAARIAPASPENINRQLAHLIGADAGIESLINLAEMIKGKQPQVCLERFKALLQGDYVEMLMVTQRDAEAWTKALRHHVTRDSITFGCSNVLRIAGRLALKEQIAPGQEAIEAALEASPDFRWLDKASGWFTMGGGGKSALATRVRKIMAVAEESIGADEIAEAVASDDALLYSDTVSPGLATPPVHVIRDLLHDWAWLKTVQKGRFLAGDGFDGDDALSDVEKAIVKLITAHQGAACLFELKAVVVDQMSLTDALLTAILGKSPFIKKLEHGIYGLRGRRLGDHALQRARNRAQARRRPSNSRRSHLHYLQLGPRLVIDTRMMCQK